MTIGRRASAHDCSASNSVAVSRLMEAKADGQRQFIDLEGCLAWIIFQYSEVVLLLRTRKVCRRYRRPDETPLVSGDRGSLAYLRLGQRATTSPLLGPRNNHRYLPEVALFERCHLPSLFPFPNSSFHLMTTISRGGDRGSLAAAAGRRLYSFLLTNSLTQVTPGETTLAADRRIRSPTGICNW
jgi:hypothetical protein